jgi:hypothetical protein
MRADITTAISKAPTNVQQDLTTTISGCLALLDEHLPKDETVQYICSAAPKTYDVTRTNCLFAITDSRFLFVAPAPQVICFYLTELDRAQSLSAQAGITTFFLEAGEAKYQLGIDAGYGPRFADLAKQASAIARLQNR